jgi:glutamyl/glutaminyl-tRNA synthetase
MSFDIKKWRVNNKIDKSLEVDRGKIVTRFAPEPSGSLHIGHCKAIFINYLIARRYDGKFILRLDDTNPETESSDFEQGILDDMNSLGVKPDMISRTSDYFDYLMSVADKLIDDGLAFVDNSSAEQMKQEREAMVDSINRDNSPTINKILWDKMKRGEKVDSVLRIKIDMLSHNGSLRDPTIYRSIDTPHQHTKDKYKAYPTYDFACPIVDSIEGVTHVYRSVEFSDRDEQYAIILKMVGMKQAGLFSFGKVIFQKEVTSKRKIKALIDGGEVEGWDDPRLLTVKGAFRRGMCLDALLEFTASMGFSKNMVSMTTDKLWTLNKQFIEKIAVRYTAFPKNNTVIFKIDYNGYEKKELGEVLKVHRSNDKSTRTMYYHDEVYLWYLELQNVIDGEEVTLMNWGNAYVDLTTNTLRLHLDGNFKKTKNKLLWLPTNRTMDITILKYKKVGKPRVEKQYIGEDQMLNIKKGDHIQLFKLNFFKCDSIDPLTLIIT